MKKIILLIISILLLCSCENKKCIKSHQENSTCSSLICIPNGKSVSCIPFIKPCQKTICDEYEIENEDKENLTKDDIKGSDE